MMEFLNAIGPWAVGALIFGIPVALAWWLSDGFANVEIGSGDMHVVPAFNPHTHRAGSAVVFKSTGAPVAYMD
jgi:hypothetical protein